MLIGIADDLLMAPDVCASVIMNRDYAGHSGFKIVRNQHPSGNVIRRSCSNFDSLDCESVPTFPMNYLSGKRFWLGAITQAAMERGSSLLLPFVELAPSRAQKRKARLILRAD